MKSGSQTRLLAVLLALFTLAAVGVGIANFLQEQNFTPATDGARWAEVQGGLLAYIVPADTPAAKAGVRQGDIVAAVDGVPTARLATLEREVAARGIWQTATYSILRKAPGGARTPVDVPVLLAPSDRTDFQAMRLIALVYLAIGLYVLLRRWGAPKSTHFFVFCLTSFVLYAFKYTGVLDGLDQSVYWCNVAAMALQPAMFLHFAVTFDSEGTRKKWRSLSAVLYLPGLVLVGMRWMSLMVWAPTERLQHRLDQIDYAYLAGYYVLAAIVFHVRYRRETQPLQRQQLKWLTRGTLLTVTPFTGLLRDSVSF